VHIEVGRPHARRLAGLADVSHRVAFRCLDLDHFGALVGQQHGAVRTKDDVGQVDDPDAFERAWHFLFLWWGLKRDCHCKNVASPPLALRRKTPRRQPSPGNATYQGYGQAVTLPVCGGRDCDWCTWLRNNPPSARARSTRDAVPCARRRKPQGRSKNRTSAAPFISPVAKIERKQLRRPFRVA